MTGRQLLSAHEEVVLAKRIERGDLDAKARMVESNIRLVYAVARSYGGGPVPLADLVQEGTIGLVRAVERFDHRRGLEVLDLCSLVDQALDSRCDRQLERDPNPGQGQAATRRGASRRG